MARKREGANVNCDVCGKEFYVPPCRAMRGARFCSREHQLAYYNSSKDPAQSFWLKVDQRGGDECWGWKAQKRWDGYGRFRVNYRAVFAHRFSYELHYGPIPAGMSVMHTCDNPECTNPKHLRLGSHQENMADMRRKGRNTKGEKNKHAKLTEAQVIEIRQRFKFYSPRRTNAEDLAPEYGVNAGTIYMAATGRTWRHL